MSSKEGPLLPTYHQNPFPFVKVFRKHLPLILISVLLTLSLLCYVFIPQIRTDTSSMAPNQNHWSSVLSQWTAQPSDQMLVNTHSINLMTDSYQTLITNTSQLSEFQGQSPVRQPVLLPSGDDPNSTVQAQRDFVKQMMRQSWNSYEKYAWGQNELKPI